MACINPANGVAPSGPVKRLRYDLLKLLLGDVRLGYAFSAAINDLPRREVAVASRRSSRALTG